MSTNTEKKAAGTSRRNGKASRPAPTKKESAKLARVKVPLNLRKGAGYDQEIIRILPTGEKLLLQEQRENGFAAVVTQSGDEGWVCMDFIEMESAEVKEDV